MAYVYATGYDGQRAYIYYETTSTATSVTVTAKFGIQATDSSWTNLGYSQQFGGKYTGGFGTKWGEKWTTSLAKNGYLQILTASKTITKTTSAQTFSFQFGGSFAFDSSSTPYYWATVSISIPALASYNVTYNANGGSGAPATQKKYYGKTLTLSSTKPTRTNYTFVRWNTNTSNTGTGYSPGGSYTGNAALALYAIWKPNTYTVSYNANGGSGAPSAQTKTHGVALTLSSTKPTRTGYTFQKWNNKADGTGANSFNPGQSYTTNASVTLYAVWKINTYTVAYNANNGTGAPASQTKTYGKALTLSSTKPTRTGYNFVRWNTKADGSGTNYNSGASYTANAGVTLYAVWTKKTYAVTYNANGGNGAPSAQTKTHGTALTLSSVVPTRTDYAFVKWNTASDGSGTDYTPGQSYSTESALTLYAIWEVYIAPKITNLIAYRTDSTGAGDDAGTYATVAFNWIEGTGPEGDILPSAIKVGYRERGTTGAYTYTSVSDLRSGTVSVNIGGGNLALNKQYDIIAVLTPSGTGRADVTRATYVSLAYFVIDVNADGSAVAFGVQAPDDVEGLIIGMEPYLTLDTTASSGTVDAELYDAIRALGWENDVIV